MREPNPFALDCFTVMQNANRLHLREHRELIEYHNSNLFTSEPCHNWLEEGGENLEGLTILDEVDAFETFFLEKLE